MKNKYTVYLASFVISIILVGIMFLMSLLACVGQFKDTEYLEYKEKYDIYYNHQLNYLMNEPIEAEDKYNKDKLCKILWLKYTPIGNSYTQMDEVYNDKYSVHLYNNSNEDVKNITIEVPYITTTGGKMSRYVYCEIVKANSYAVGTISMNEYFLTYDYSYVKTDDCAEFGLCYTEPNGGSEITKTEAQELINEDLIVDIIGEKVEPKTTSELLSIALPYILVTGILFIILVVVIVKTAILSNKLNSGNYVIANGKVVLKTSPEAEEAIRKQERIQALKKNTKGNDGDETSKVESPTVLPADFDDGHKTTHDCGGFEINPDDFKIDPNDY